MRPRFQSRPATGLPKSSWWLPSPSFAPRYSKALAATAQLLKLLNHSTAQLLNRPVSAFAEKYQRVDSARTECNRLMSLVCSLNPILVTCASANHWRDKVFATFATVQGMLV